MSIIFSKHARLKILQRRIPTKAVLAVVRLPDFRMPGRNLREELYKKFRGIYLKVVMRQEQNRIIIITAHLVAKVPKN